MHVLMTGANGMLGRDMCALLEQAGHKVVRTDRAAPPNEVVPEWEPLDITDTDAVKKCLLHHQPDVVIHAAACTDVDGCERDPDRAYKINGLGTWNVAAICGNHNMTLAYISTDFVFDGTKKTPYNEFDTPNPLSHYGMSKYAGEKFVAQLCRRHFIVRTAWLFGVHGGKSFPDKILALAKTRKELFMVTDQIGSPTYTIDLSRALIDLLDSPLYGTYHVTNAGQCSWYELAKKTLELAGETGMEVKPIPASQYSSPTKRPEYSVLSRCALEIQGKDNLRPWQQALADFIDRRRHALGSAGH